MADVPYETLFPPGAGMVATVNKSISAVDTADALTDIKKRVVRNFSVANLLTTIPVAGASSNQPNTIEYANGGLQTFAVWTDGGESLLARVKLNGVARFHMVDTSAPSEGGAWSSTDRLNCDSAVYVRSTQVGLTVSNTSDTNGYVIQLNTNTIIRHERQADSRIGALSAHTYSGGVWTSGTRLQDYGQGSSSEAMDENRLCKITTTKFSYIGVDGNTSPRMGLYSLSGTTITQTGALDHSSGPAGASRPLNNTHYNHCWVVSTSTLRMIAETNDGGGNYYLDHFAYTISGTSPTYSTGGDLTVNSTSPLTIPVSRVKPRPHPIGPVQEKCVIIYQANRGGGVNGLYAIVWDGSQKGTTTLLTGTDDLSGVSTNAWCCSYAGGDKYVLAYVTGGVLKYFNFDVNWTSGAITKNTVASLTTWKGVTLGAWSNTQYIGRAIWNDTSNEALMTLSFTGSTNNFVRGDKGTTATGVAKWTTSGATTTLTDWWGLGPLLTSAGYLGSVCPLDTTGSPKLYAAGGQNSAVGAAGGFMYAFKYNSSKFQGINDVIPLGGTPLFS